MRVQTATTRKRACMLALPMLVLAVNAVAAQRSAIETNRRWDRLPPPTADAGRKTLAAAADTFGRNTLHLAGVPVDRALLSELAATPADEPLLRAARERIGRPVDLQDFLLLLDDLAAADAHGRGTPEVWVPSGRARSAGILLHPDDVFDGQPRRYGGKALAIFRPKRPAKLPPANNGDPLGANWTARYLNPLTEEKMLAALEHAGTGDFAKRLRELLMQFRAQGAEAYVFSTVRSRERGYLIYGSFILSRAQSRRQVRARVAKLERLNRQWGLDVPIRWRHPDGWRATIDAAREMASAYNVVYATERGARYSSHYGGSAVDFAVVDLPRRVTLTAPNGHASRTFDLSAAQQPRDLNLTPELIQWVENHFGLNKLRADYPHWTDAMAGD